MDGSQRGSPKRYYYFEEHHIPRAAHEQGWGGFFLMSRSTAPCPTQTDGAFRDYPKRPTMNILLPISLPGIERSHLCTLLYLWDPQSDLGTRDELLRQRTTERWAGLASPPNGIASSRGSQCTCGANRTHRDGRPSTKRAFGTAIANARST